VTCRDLPEAIAQGETVEEALVEAADCLEEAIQRPRVNPSRINASRP
jgi:predicted RNase H-like HicB family nuclease